MKWFKNLHVRHKLFISFSVIIVFVLGLASVAAISVHRIDSSYTYLLDFPQKRLESLMALDKNCSDMRRATTGVALNAGNDPMVESFWAQYDEAYQKALGNANGYIDNYRNDQVRDSAEVAVHIDAAGRILEQLTKYRAQAEKALVLAKAGEFDSSNAAFLEGAPLIAEVASQTGKLVTSASEYTAMVSDANTRDKEIATALLITLTCVILLASLTIEFGVANIISKPLAFYAKTIMAMGSTGNLQMDSESSRFHKIYVEQKDEVGDIAEGIDKMVQMLHDKVKTLEMVASNDLAVEIEHLSSEDVISNSLQKMVDNLNGVFGEMNDVSRRVSLGAEQIAGGTQILAQGTTEQAAAVEELATSIAQVADKAKENASMGAQAAELAIVIKNNVEKSSAQMMDMTQAVRQINEASHSINRVIQVIDSIAVQTNLLALNAAVEAARAGQHGKGFAVVAAEVRSLAVKSSAAAKDTAKLIANSMEKAEYGSRIAQETAVSLSEIVAVIDENSQIVSSIAQSSEEQSHSVSQINVNIDQVTTVVQQNSAATEEGAAAAQEMSTQSTLLRESIARFKLAKDHQAQLTPGDQYEGNDWKHNALPPPAQTKRDVFGKY